MNLDFVDIQPVTYNDTRYMLQRCKVTGNGRFWSAWRYANASGLKTGLNSCITLLKKGSEWYAFRLLPEDSGLPMGKFPMSYIMARTDGLLPYQPPAVTQVCNSIICNGAAIDGSDCGIGKTYHAISAARDLGLVPAVIARNSGLMNWKHVCKHFGIAPLFIISWESAKNGSGKFQYVKRLKDNFGKYQYTWKLPKNTLLIFDECHMACNVDSQNYALWQSSKGRASISLSATFADRPARLKGLLNLLNVITPAEFDSWLKKRTHFQNVNDELEALSSVSDMKAIHKILYPAYGCRLADDHPAVKAFFPEAKYAVEIIYIGKKQQEIQNSLYAEMLSKVEYYKKMGKQADALVADLRYRQATELLKADALIDLVEDYREQGKAVCVFVNFRETLSYIAKKVKTTSLIFGEQERYGIDRNQVIDDFQAGKKTVLLSMVNSGGQSISLHDISGKNARVSLVCPTYDPIALQQVFGRTHRSGSKSKPIIKLVYAANTIEEKVSQVVNEKINNIKALNDGDLMEPDLFKFITASERIQENN